MFHRDNAPYFISPRAHALRHRPKFTRDQQIIANLNRRYTRDDELTKMREDVDEVKQNHNALAERVDSHSQGLGDCRVRLTRVEKRQDAADKEKNASQEADTSDDDTTDPNATVDMAQTGQQPRPQDKSLDPGWTGDAARVRIRNQVLGAVTKAEIASITNQQNRFWRVRKAA
jgi:hypothetical protein